MTTPRIEEMAGEVWRLIKDEWEEKDGKLPSGWTGIGSAYGSYSRLIEALTEARQAGIDEAVERDATVVCLLEQIIEMNGEDWFWSYMAKMPITKFNAPLRKALDDTNKALQDNK